MEQKSWYLRKFVWRHYQEVDRRGTTEATIYTSFRNGREILELTNTTDRRHKNNLDVKEALAVVETTTKSFFHIRCSCFIDGCDGICAWSQLCHSVGSTVVWTNALLVAGSLRRICWLCLPVAALYAVWNIVLAVSLPLWCTRPAPSEYILMQITCPQCPLWRFSHMPTVGSTTEIVEQTSCLVALVDIMRVFVVVMFFNISKGVDARRRVNVWKHASCDRLFFILGIIPPSSCTMETWTLQLRWVRSRTWNIFTCYARFSAPL